MEVAHGRIEIDPKITFGKPVIKGTRVTVEQILRKLGGGMTVSEILADHPHLTLDDVYAAAAFAADYLAQDINDLRIPPGNRLEKLKSDREGQYSIRINDQYRICFEWRDGDAYRVEIVDYH